MVGEVAQVLPVVVVAVPTGTAAPKVPGEPPASGVASGAVCAWKTMFVPVGISACQENACHTGAVPAVGQLAW